MTPPPFRVIAFSGSLRKASTNTGLIRMAARLAPPELAIEIPDYVPDVPFFNEDLESNPPAAVVRFRADVAAADGLLIGTPEYNGAASAVVRNAIDWLTRHGMDRALHGKVIALLSSGGRGGGRRAQESVEDILEVLGNTVVKEPYVCVPMGFNLVTPDGTTSDPEVEEAVRAKLAAMVATLRTAATATSG